MLPHKNEFVLCPACNTLIRNPQTGEMLIPIRKIGNAIRGYFCSSCGINISFRELEEIKEIQPDKQI